MAVRVCHAAREQGLDISGAMFRVGGEPLTEAKAEAITQAGASWVSAWAMAETGTLGVACGNREARDEVHVVRGKVALLQRSKYPVRRTLAHRSALPHHPSHEDPEDHAERGHR